MTQVRVLAAKLGRVARPLPDDGNCIAASIAAGTSRLFVGSLSIAQLRGYGHRLLRLMVKVPRLRELLVWAAEAAGACACLVALCLISLFWLEAL